MLIEQLSGERMHKILVTVLFLIAAQSSFAKHCSVPNSNSGFAVGDNPTAVEISRCGSLGGTIVRMAPPKAVVPKGLRK